MKKRLIIFIPILAVLILLAAFLLVNYFQPPAWKDQLNQYLAFQRQAGEPVYRVVAAVKASQPINFLHSYYNY
jgi:hypothetical protein